MFTSSIIIGASLLGCQAEPIASSLSRQPFGSGPRSATAAIMPACTRSWAQPVSGAFDDWTRWSPVGVPGPSDIVCITAAGTASYVVTLSSEITIAGLQLGGLGALANLVVDIPTNWAEVTVTGDAFVMKGSKLRVAPAGGPFELRVDGASGLVNHGQVTSDGSSLASWLELRASRLENTGTLDLYNSRLYLFRPLESTNSGAIIARPYSTITAEGGARVFRHTNGSIAGDIIFQGGVNGASMRVVWQGGTITGDTTFYRGPRIDGATLVFADSMPAGRLKVSGWSHSRQFVEGDVPPRVHLTLLGGDSTVLTMTNPHTGVTVNRGTLEVSEFVSSSAYSLVFDGLVNRGSVLFVGDAPVKVFADSIANGGIVRSEPALHFLRPRRLFANRGTLSLGGATARLVMSARTEFLAGQGSLMTGLLQLDSAIVSGTGRVGDVRSAGGTVNPGAPFGSLTLNSLTLDRHSVTNVDVRGIGGGDFDQLNVRGHVRYGGALVFRGVSEGMGICGNEITIMTDSTPGDRGAFDQVVGVTGATTGWRTYSPVGSLQALGYDPSGPLGLGLKSMSLTEGAGPSYYAVCLGPTAPTAAVTLTRTRRFTEIEADPRTVTWSTTDWMFPQLVGVLARNDVVVDGVHSDSVLHSLTSSDPTYNPGLVYTMPINILDTDGSGRLANPVVTRRRTRTPEGRVSATTRR